MNFDPQKFFIGLTEFFSILLPGAVAVFVFGPDLRALGTGMGVIVEPGAETWSAFFVASYLAGHLVNLAGAWLLDGIYDRIRQGADDEQVKRLAAGESMSPLVLRAAARLIVKKDMGKALRQAIRAKERHLAPFGSADAINAYQWCKTRLSVESPAGYSVVQRLEADSKFFRSLVVVLCLVTARTLPGGTPEMAAAFVPVILLAFWRYADQRAKATTQACWYIITDEAAKADPDSAAEVRKGKPTHAGGVVVRQGANGRLVLLVRPRTGQDQWVLPKGHVEPGESLRETAVREVREEAGVWGRVVADLGDIAYAVNGAEIAVRIFLLEHVKSVRPLERRDSNWFTFGTAREMATHETSRSMLKRAEEALDGSGVRNA